jgi:hypothetical protein
MLVISQRNFQSFLGIPMDGWYFFPQLVNLVDFL